MNNYYTFQKKWRHLKKDNNLSSTKDVKARDEKILFTDVGSEPVTQRQINLYYYFLFIKEIVEKVKAKDVLEIGCGRGTMSLYLASYLGKSVSLLDNEKAAIEIAKSEFTRLNLPAKFFIADALDTGLEGESFDAIISIGLAEHIDDVERLFKEQYRLLRKGGVMISLNIPKKISVQKLNDIMKFFKFILNIDRDKLKHKDYYRNNLKPKDYKNIAQKVGFREVQITHVCPFPIFTPIKMETDKKIAKIYRIILKFRRLIQKYPFKTNYLFSQGHFLVGYKK